MVVIGIAHQRRIEADDGAEQADEGGGGADGRKERQAAGETGVDRILRAGKRTVEPVVRVEVIRHLGVLFFGGIGVLDELAPGAVLVQFGCTFAKGRRAPETGADALVLVHDPLLFEQLGEQDVERADRHDHQHGEDRPGDHAALLHRFHEAKLGLRSGRSGGGEKLESHCEGPLFNWF